MIKYKTKKYDVEIAPVEISKETECFVWVKGNQKDFREAKNSAWSAFHDTWQAAKDYLVARESQKVDALRLQLERAKGELGNAKGLREPS
jgi:hypothetical protein